MNTKSFVKNSSFEKTSLQKQVDTLQILVNKMDNRLSEIEVYLREECYDEPTDCSEELSEEFFRPNKKNKLFAELD